MKPTYLCIHHTAVKRTKTPQLFAVNRYHKEKGWSEQTSRLGWYVGYNAFVDVDGTFTQTRLVGEETYAQKGHNCTSWNDCSTVSVCFALNGNKEVLNAEQIETFRKIRNGEIRFKQYGGSKISAPEKVVGHRDLQINRDCPGKLLSNEYLRDLFIFEPTVKEDVRNGKNIRELQSILDRLRNTLHRLLITIENYYGRNQT